MSTVKNESEAAQALIEEQVRYFEKLLAKGESFKLSAVSLLAQQALGIEDDELVTRCYLLLSDYHARVLVDHVKALEFARFALQQCEDIPDFYWRIKSLLTTAQHYFFMREYSSQLSMQQQALTLLEAKHCQSLDYYPLHFDAHYGMAQVFMNIGFHGLGMPYLREASRYAELMNDRMSIFKPRLAMANVLLYQKKRDEAYEMYLQLLDEYKDMGDTDPVAIINGYIGLLLYYKKDYKQAEVYMREAMRIRQSIGNEFRTSLSYATFCKLLYDMGNREEGDFYFNALLQAMDKYAHFYDAQVRNTLLYEVYASRGEYKEAWEHFRHLDIAYSNHAMLEKTVGAIFEVVQQKQLSSQDEALQLRRMNEEIHQQTSQLKSLNNDLKNYARTASHDLREPLRMVSTYMTILESKLKDRLTEEEKKLMNFAVDGSKRMDEMITRILSTAKGTQSGFKPVDLNKTMELLKANLGKLIQEKNARVTHDPLPALLGDDIQLLQVFQNLVTNALKYNISPVPTVHISAQKIQGRNLITVADNGLGIPQDARTRVFEMFQRVENASGAEGTGIGLSTVKNIVEKMHGKIWIEGNEPQGSIFNLLFDANLSSQQA